MIIAQFSDTHIKDGSEEGVAGMQAAVAHILQLPALPDVVVITGDCTDGGTATEYARFWELLQPLPMPVYVIPGNHDHRQRLHDTVGAQGRQPLPGFMQYTVEAGPLRLLMLDTLLPGSDAGELCPQRLQWLEDRLAEAPDKTTLVFMHHPPFRTGQAPFDRIGLRDAAAFGAIIARHAQVERVAAGHVHAGVQRRFQGTVAVTCPSVMHQLLPDFRQPERLIVATEPPAMLLHVWQEGIGLLTYTSPIAPPSAIIELHNGTDWLTPPREVRARGIQGQ
ncbi:phosphodiesterase [Hymenobacter busanensis]|uniref:Phosphodiesterase n=1 Tax=Hymenobacter busanensis TaxID=2607656 RepID=A0A7L5A1Q1_9BACT|nr:phosphodiesterase [Hymenobacter busanensis]KAA9338556.1 phosphodiesterase [Hymenobacter busanensis]QHJ09016.1 phosphodiesterase [Hymenobacter busanensis]